MARYSIPSLSPEAESFVESILGSVPREIEVSELTSEQAEQLLIVLETEVTQTPARREVAELAAAILRTLPD